MQGVPLITSELAHKMYLYFLPIILLNKTIPVYNTISLRYDLFTYQNLSFLRSLTFKKHFIQIARSHLYAYHIPTSNSGYVRGRLI